MAYKKSNCNYQDKNKFTIYSQSYDIAIDTNISAYLFKVVVSKHYFKKLGHHK